ncbi:hypothetical protein DRO26_01415, partial [Candidatus Bathyarchaeota archaeon]
MNRKNLFLTVFLVFALLLSMVQTTTLVQAQTQKFSITQVYWSSETEKVQAKPGDKNLSLNVVIQNTGTETMSGVTAKLYLENTPFRTPA